MTGLEGLAFTAPYALFGLLGLPLVWWLSRLTPPRPKQQIFPGARLLDGLADSNRQAARHPLLLLILRLIAFTLVVLALSGPVLEDQKLFENSDPVLIVLEDGFAAGPGWQRQQAVLQQALQAAATRNLPVTLIGTAPRMPDGRVLFFEREGARSLEARVADLEPQAWPTRAGQSLTRLEQADWQGQYQILWLEDGIDGAEDMALFTWLQDRGVVKTSLHDLPVLAISDARRQADSLDIRIASTGLPIGDATDNPPAWLRLSAKDGQNLAREALPPADTDGIGMHRVVIDLPPEVMNKANRLSLENNSGAASVYFLDSRHQRNSALIIDAASIRQPLLSETHYLENALDPGMQIDRLAPADAVAQVKKGPGIVLIGDQGSLPENLRNSLQDYLAHGGVVVRFAGPALAAVEEPWLPVILRQGSRATGSTLSWDRPVALGDFEESSPFFGLPVARDIRVRQQVLADPGQLGDAQVWARLVDGTPLITARREGRGWFVLFHIPARAGWSSLPLSGMFVGLLDRLTGLSAIGTATSEQQADAAIDTSTSLITLQRRIDGLGRLVEPGPTPWRINRNDLWQAAFDSPPGFYGKGDGQLAFNTGAGIDDLHPVDPAISALRLSDDGVRLVTSLTLPLVIAALVVLLIEMLTSAFFMRGGAFRFFHRQSGKMAALMVAGLMLGLISFAPNSANAQSISPTPDYGIGSDRGDKIMQAVLETRLAYIITGDPELDAKSEAGLRGLSHALIRRTSVEPAAPVGVDPSEDELRLYPLLYWPISDDMQMPGPVALDNLRQYNAIGGTIVFDTQDAFGEAVSGSLPARRKLAWILGKLDAPVLDRIPPQHILTRAFYLLQAFPGRYDNGDVWVEQQGELGFDGVSRFVIGAQDWAGAWAVDQNGIPNYAIPGQNIRGGADRRREMAWRFGVNLVMYVLTGNYKADQVHVPAILERLGQ